MPEHLLHELLHALIDTLKAIPILYLVYLAIELMNLKINSGQLSSEKLSRLGPVLGAGLGCIPQCGFSSASAALYNAGVIKGSTLVAVFLATSDEAIPILLSNTESAPTVIWIILCKFILAVVAGYILCFTVFAKQRSLAAETIGVIPSAEDAVTCGDSCCCGGSIWWNAAKHTIKISLFILITLVAINIVLFFIGEDRLQQILLSGTLLQPVLAALLGLIPGCGTSVLLTQLYLGGTLSFGSVLAGLSAGAGFGYIILFRGAGKKRDAFKIIICTYVAAVIAGIIVQTLGF